MSDILLDYSFFDGGRGVEKVSSCTYITMLPFVSLLCWIPMCSFPCVALFYVWDSISLKFRIAYRVGLFLRAVVRVRNAHWFRSTEMNGTLVHKRPSSRVFHWNSSKFVRTDPAFGQGFATRRNGHGLHACLAHLHRTCFVLHARRRGKATFDASETAGGYGFLTFRTGTQRADGRRTCRAIAAEL